MPALSEEVQEFGTAEGNHVRLIKEIAMFLISHLYSYLSDTCRYSQGHDICVSTLWTATKHKTNAENAHGCTFRSEEIQMSILWQRIQTLKSLEGENYPHTC